MTCNCLGEVLVSTEREIQKQNKDWKISDIEWLKKGWNFSGKGNPINLYNEIKISYTFTKVNGSESSPKSTTISIYGNYCSFCGKKFVENEQD